MLVGYAQASSADPNLNLQFGAPKRAGCERVFADQAGGARDNRPGLAQALSHLRSSGRLIVWKLDRLGRTVRQLVSFAENLKAERVEFGSLTDGIDTSTPAGHFFFHMMAALAEMERDLVRERTCAALAAARARGRRGRRHPKLTQHQLAHARRLLAGPAVTVTEVAATFKVARSTLYRAVSAEPRLKRREAQKKASFSSSTQTDTGSTSRTRGASAS